MYRMALVEPQLKMFCLLMNDTLNFLSIYNVTLHVMLCNVPNYHFCYSTYNNNSLTSLSFFLFLEVNEAKKLLAMLPRNTKPNVSKT